MSAEPTPCPKCGGPRRIAPIENTGNDALVCDDCCSAEPLPEAYPEDIDPTELRRRTFHERCDEESYPILAGFKVRLRPKP